ncbi:energy transducer TonB [Lewinella sp. 4G2]|uniref:energy transducer TonB n=1 Tax=Lewinella sp. 4G2 TaxID=1803372 RepID=UPI0018D4AC03|nr:energy transducer TonB [Lewinella sp. 4G2]
MKFILFFLASLPCLLFAQEAPADTLAPAALGDTTIYSFADAAARFPTPCERYDTTAQAKTECSDIAVLDYVNQRAGYPEEARRQNISGTAVIAFVVEKEGIISQARILRDPGGGLGISALRAVAEMASNVRWIPAMKDGKPVRYRYTLPIRFKLEAPKPYVLTDRDTVYVEFEQPAKFIGADSTFGNYFNKNISYPSSGEDSCQIGQLDVQLLIKQDGSVTVQDITDYNDLGTDFTFEAINVATNSFRQWKPAEYQGRKVTTAYDISVVFAPQSAACQSTVTNYNSAAAAMNEAQVMVQDTNQLDAGLAKMDLAIAQFPKDGRFRIIRGQTRMDNNLLGGACEDFRVAKRIALIDWYDQVLPLLCRGVEE